MLLCLLAYFRRAVNIYCLAVHGVCAVSTISLCTNNNYSIIIIIIRNKFPKWGFCHTYAVISLEAVAYSLYCNTVEWFWWD